MKILVVSDTHGNTELLHDVVFRHHACIDLVVHLGDNFKDIQEVMRDFPTVANIGVLGNCDYPSMYQNPLYDGKFTAEKRKIFYTHGHRYNVEYGFERLCLEAKYKGFDVVMYGHTHMAFYEEINGVYVLNPGSLSRPRDGSNGTYAMLDIVGSEVKCNIVEVEK